MHANANGHHAFDRAPLGASPALRELHQSRHAPSIWTVVLADGTAHLVHTHDLQHPAAFNATIGRAITPPDHADWYTLLNALMVPLRSARH